MIGEMERKEGVTELLRGRRGYSRNANTCRRPKTKGEPGMIVLGGNQA